MLSKYWRPVLLFNKQYQLNNHLPCIQKFATQVQAKPTPSIAETDSLENAKPTEQIPGPTAYQFIRGVLPGGAYYKKPISEILMIMSEQFGQIFRLPGMFGRPPTYMITNPDDFAVMYRNEGQWPARRNFDTMVYHRAVHRREFFQGVEGILNTIDEKWYNVRAVVNPILMQPKNAHLYFNTMLEVNDEFLIRIREIRDPSTLEMPDTFENEINCLTLETVSAVALNTHLGLLRKNHESAESAALLKCLRSFFDLAYALEVMPSIWKIIKTPKFYQMMKSLDTLTDICIKYIDEAMAKFERDSSGKLAAEIGKEKSVLEKLLRHDKKVAVVMAMDMMMAGVDTTSTSMAGILLCIAQNPDKQQKLLEEIKKILPEKDSRLTIENMKNLPYLRACIKEGMRIHPIGPGNMRRIQQEVVMSGYRLPKNSDVVAVSNLLVFNEKFVPRAKEFIPERFLRGEGKRTDLMGVMENPFTYLPFGFGPRSCIGKRIVDMELEINVARLVRNFNIEFNHPAENAFKESLIRVPAIPLKFKFEERKE